MLPFSVSSQPFDLPSSLSPLKIVHTHYTWKPRTPSTPRLIVPCRWVGLSQGWETPRLEFLVLLEEHAEADDGPVDQQSADYGHDHGLDADEVGVGEDDGQG